MVTASSEGGGPLYPHLATEIAAMCEVDQTMRKAAMEGGTWDPEIDRRHTERLKAIIADIGWPARTHVGEKASHGAWLLAQHADHDVDFQRECLRLVREAGPGEALPADVAYLEDRVAVHEGRPQRYGTQFRAGPDGGTEPSPIEDPDRLDERRRAVGLGPFEEYERLIRATDKRTLTTRTVGRGLRCPFCGTSGEAVELLVVGPQKTAICPTCAGTARSILEGTPPPLGWRVLRSE